MKFASYESRGVATFGAVVDDLVYDLSDGSAASLRIALGGGSAVLAARTRAVLDSGVAGQDIGSLLMLPVIPDPAKIICVGVNYRAHRDEAGRDPIATPTIFFRFADTQMGHRRPAVMPAATSRFDYEGELAVVIGRACRAVPEADALDVVGGYACYNDLTARDWQRHASQWGPGKNFPHTGGFGPYLVTPDEVGDLATLQLQTRVNGEVRQDASVGDLLFSVPELIAYISTFTPLDVGDVIVTGTPGGVGQFMEPPTFLQVGDAVEVEISRLGTLRTVVIGEGEPTS